ncbi:MAG: AIR synthase-related protein, partial [Planctomycetota bacterium]|nr:AIR synthase-related protein [Planctomycetota bacterium]
NLVCVGADPDRIAILDNFCWPSCGKPANLASLVRAAEGCYDAAKAYRTPFVSGKDSLNNQFTTDDGRTIEIPPTLLISGIGIVHDTWRCVTSDAKRAGNLLLLVGATGEHLGGSHIQQILSRDNIHVAQVGASAAIPTTDLERGPELARAVHQLITAGHVRAAHDCSDGGLLTAVAEMLIAAAPHEDSSGPRLGASVDLSSIPFMATANRTLIASCFAENTSRYVLEISRGSLKEVGRLLGELPHAVIAELDHSGALRMSAAGLDLDVLELRRAFTSTLNF